MSLWQLSAAVDGWNAAHGAEAEPEAPAADEFWDMVARLH